MLGRGLGPVRRQEAARKEWRVVGAKPSHTFPSPEALQDLDGLRELVLPVPAPARPQRTSSKSHRLRQRHQRRMLVWRQAVRMLTVLNALDRGRVKGPQTTSRLRNTNDGQVKAAWLSIQSMVLSEASSFVAARRRFSLTGAHAVARVLKIDSADVYSSHVRTITRSRSWRQPSTSPSTTRPWR